MWNLKVNWFVVRGRWVPRENLDLQETEDPPADLEKEASR